MNEVLNDIQTLEHAIIAFTEGASDERRSALSSLESLMADKRQQVQEFEAQYAPADL